MKTLYVTDLDGTLLTKEERISEYSLEKINALVDRGLLFTPRAPRGAQIGRQEALNVIFPPCFTTAH